MQLSSLIQNYKLNQVLNEKHHISGAHSKPCQKSEMKYVDVFRGITRGQTHEKPLTIFTKKVHLICLTGF